MSRFNLIDEKWIPVRFLNGTRGELGIIDTLLRSKEIAAIEDQSPLVVAALHRFLLAVLYRALEGPTDIDQAKNLFTTGLPEDKIKAYLEKWRNRFWLFDEKYPFGQNPHVPEDEIEPWTKLTAEYNATSNKVLFDHTDTTNLCPVLPNKIARWIISTLNFSVRGGRGYRPSPSSGALICIPKGNDLHQTMLLSLVPYPNRNVMEQDSALWERNPNKLPLKVSERVPFGYADLYTWQARLMRLIVGKNEECTEVAFIPGIGYDHETSTFRDPMVPYRVGKKGVRQIEWEERGLWRSFSSLLPDVKSPEGLEPGVVNYLASLSLKRLITSSVTFNVIGQKFKNASVEFWRMECFRFPFVIDRPIKSEIDDMLRLAENTRGALEIAFKDTGKALLTKTNRALMPDKWVAGNLKPGDVTKYLMSIGALSQFWSALELHFHEILGEYALGRNPDDIRLQWLTHVRDALKTAWEQHVGSVSAGDAWAIRALVKAECAVRDKEKELDKEIEKYKKQEVNQ
ncbi:MAG: type I-E CRISPR-associated protein Cse1/CasA [Candidatus Omnitrophota bacterium]